MPGAPHEASMATKVSAEVLSLRMSITLAALYARALAAIIYAAEEQPGGPDVLGCGDEQVLLSSTGNCRPKMHSFQDRRQRF